VVTVAEPVGELAAGGGAGKTLTAAHRTHGHISHCTIAYVGTSAVKRASSVSSVAEALKGVAEGLHLVRRGIQANVRTANNMQQQGMY